jgi:glycosyltransferase involved in cell wall biosynthesis
MAATLERSNFPLRAPRSALNDFRVCFIAGTLGQGGAERQLYYMLRCLRDAGACAKVLSLSTGEFWEKPIRDLGFEVVHVGGSSSRLKRLARILGEVRQFRPDVVQAQHFYVNLYAAVAARISGCREVGAIRNNVINELADVGGSLARASLRLPRVLASNSRAAIRVLEQKRLGRARLFFLPNVVGLDRFSPGLGRVGQSLTVLGVGRLGEQKRFDLFLEVLARVSARVDVRGVIAGDGPLRAKLESHARCLGLLPDKVDFLGRVANVTPLYQRADLLLLTSDYEGTPNVVLEAMASGLPVIGTRVGDVPDLLGEGKRGRLVAPGDLEALVLATEGLLGDPHSRNNLVKQASAHVESEHSESTLTAHLKQLYSLTLAT